MEKRIIISERVKSRAASTIEGALAEAKSTTSTKTTFRGIKIQRLKDLLILL